MVTRFRPMSPPAAPAATSGVDIEVPGVTAFTPDFDEQRRDANTVAVTKWEENSRGIIIVEVIAQTLTQATREALAEAMSRGYGECVVLPWRHSRSPWHDPGVV